MRAEGYGFQIEMAYRVAQTGGRITEVPIHFADREVGQSKMSSRIAVEALVLVTRWGVVRARGRGEARGRGLADSVHPVSGPGRAAPR